MLSSKPLLANGPKAPLHTTVTFPMEDTNESSKGINSTRPTRKKVAEPFVIHEIRPWSSFYGVPPVEQVLTDINTQSTDSYVPKTSRDQSLQQVIVDQSLSFNQERQNRYRSALIDRNKQQYHRDIEFTWRSLFGTMSDINHIFMDKRFLHGLSFLKILIIFIDSCFRGIGQVMFANNPLSGLVSLQPNIYRIRKNQKKSRKLQI
jgi:hypothetical protein